MNHANHHDSTIRRAAESLVQHGKKLLGPTAVAAALMAPSPAQAIANPSHGREGRPAPSHKEKPTVPELKSLPQAAHELAVRLDKQQAARYWKGTAYITESANTGGSHYQTIKTGGSEFPAAELPTKSVHTIKNPFLIKLHNPKSSASYNEVAELAVGSLHVNPETGKAEINIYRLDSNVVLAAADGSGTFNPAIQSGKASFMRGETGLDPSRPQENGGPLLDQHDQYEQIGRDMSDKLPF